MSENPGPASPEPQHPDPQHDEGRRTPDTGPGPAADDVDGSTGSTDDGGDAGA